MARYVSRLSAAAFAVGISLAGPQAIAAADTADDSAAQAPANPTAQQTERTAPASTHPGDRTPRRADTRPSTRVGEDTGADPRRAPERRAEADNPRAGTALSERARRTAATEPGSTAPAAAVATGAARAPTRDATPAAASPIGGVIESAPASGASPALPVEAAVAEPAPAVSQTVAAPPAAAATASPTGGAGDLLSPIQSFLEGIALLVRRTFFNQAPTVNPVQTTGQLTGPITGTIGAVDPEGDAMVYTVTRNPQFGTVIVAPDGSYVYTPDPDFTGLDAFVVSATDQGLHINLFDPFRPASTTANGVVSQGRAAWVQFDFRYTGGTFLWSPEARSTLEYAATILSSYLQVEAPVTVSYTAEGQFAPFSGQLASATSDIISSQPGFYPTVVQAKIVSGTDVNGQQADGTITWNFANPWSLTETTAGGEYDFQSVAMHELMHTLGFLSTVGAPGSNTDTGWTAYDGFLVTSDGTGVIGGDFRWNSAYDANLTGGGGGLYFGGPAAVAAFGGPVPLFTPATWQAGSSVSHLNDGVFYGRTKKLMTARVNTGTGVRTLSPVETAILADLGYTVTGGSGGSVSLFVAMVLLRRRRRRV